MSDASTIEWTDATWNPVRGCDKVSPGCKNCYAERFAERFRGVKGHAYERGFDVRTVPEALDVPLKWKRPRRIFVNSMSDLFHKDVPDDFIAAIFAVMALCPQHTFQVLTKRADRMRAWFEWAAAEWPSLFPGGDAHPTAKLPPDANIVLKHARGDAVLKHIEKHGEDFPAEWPLPNVWLGVSVEDEKRARERIPHLLATPAAVRFLSCEPLLGPVDLCPFLGDVVEDGAGYLFDGVDWVIVGGESGPGARAFNADWARSIVGQCKATGTPCFVKQMGSRCVDPQRFRWVRQTIVNPGEYRLLGPRDEHAATIFTPNVSAAADVDAPGPCTWFTWDGAGIGGENGVDPDLETAKAEALAAAMRWGRFPLRFSKPKGNDPKEWSAELRVREFPEVRP